MGVAFVLVMRSLTAFSLLALVACASSSTSSQQQPVSQNGTVASPTSGAEVDVALAAARLGEENCTHDESKDLATKACAAPTPGAPRGTGMCGGPCIFSNVQLSFTAPATGKAAHVQIVSASLVDAVTGAQVQALSAYTPLDWNGTTYVDWDENVLSGTEVKASYTLSPPAWSQIDPSRNYSRQYKYVIVIGLDGGTTTVESPAMTRDPPVAT
jgi:hypothetical protein